jgi:hypothetical protein
MNASEAREMSTNAAKGMTAAITEESEHVAVIIKRKIKEAADAGLFRVVNPLVGIRLHITPIARTAAYEMLRTDGYKVHVADSCVEISWNE